MKVVPLPKVNTLVDMTILGGETYPSRVEDERGEQLVLAAPMNLLVSDLPAVGTVLSVGWAGPRGRHTLPAKVVSVKAGRLATWVVQVTGPIQIEQKRQFVRGGGGEPIEFTVVGVGDEKPITGMVVDISERSVRGRFRWIQARAGHLVQVTVTLDEEIVHVAGSVLRVVEQPELPARDVVVVFEPSENDATIIRRYVLRQQMLARAKTAGF